MNACGSDISISLLDPQLLSIMCQLVAYVVVVLL